MLGQDMENIYGQGMEFSLDGQGMEFSLDGQGIEAGWCSHRDYNKD